MWCFMQMAAKSSESSRHPLYVTVMVREVECKRTMLDQGSSLNIISLLVLDLVGVPQDNITRQSIKV